jgi:hypothetical protein
MARKVLSASTPVAFNLQDFRNSAYEKINANFAELYSKLSWGYGAPGAAAGLKGTIYLRLDGGANTVLYVREADGSPVAASNTLTLTGNAVAAEQVIIGNVTYSFRDVLVAAYDVLVGATASDSLDNLIAAINGAAGEGTTYGTGTVAHPDVTAAAGVGDTMTATVISAGEAGNLIETSETLTAGNWTYDNMYGGVDDDGTGWVAK